MSKLFRYGGVVASIILIAVGLGSLYMGVHGRDQVRSDLPARKNDWTPPCQALPRRLRAAGRAAKGAVLGDRRWTKAP